MRYPILRFACRLHENRACIANSSNCENSIFLSDKHKIIYLLHSQVRKFIETGENITFCHCNTISRPHFQGLGQKCKNPKKHDLEHVCVRKGTQSAQSPCRTAVIIQVFTHTLGNSIGCSRPNSKATFMSDRDAASQIRLFRLDFLDSARTCFPERHQGSNLNQVHCNIDDLGSY